MRSRYTWTLLLLATTTACRTQPSTQDLAKELRTVTSWAATAQQVSLAWLQNRVPDGYAKQTLHKTQTTLHEELKTLSKVAPPQHQAAALEQVKQLEHTVEQMATELDRQDRTALAQTLPVLSHQAESLQTFMQQRGAQP